MKRVQGILLHAAGLPLVSLSVDLSPTVSCIEIRLFLLFATDHACFCCCCRCSVLFVNCFSKSMLLLKKQFTQEWKFCLYFPNLYAFFCFLQNTEDIIKNVDDRTNSFGFHCMGINCMDLSQFIYTEERKSCRWVNYDIFGWDIHLRSFTGNYFSSELVK